MPTDEELVELSKAGDRTSFEQLFVKYRDAVFNLARSVVGDAEQAEDTTQETFVRAYVGLPGFRGRSQFRTWLYRIAVNQALRVKSASARRKHVEQPLEDLSLCSDRPEPGEALELSEIQKSVRRAIAELPAGHSAAVTLRYIEGLSIAEVAEILGSPVGTIKSRLHHALKSMSFRLRDWRDV